MSLIRSEGRSTGEGCEFGESDPPSSVESDHCFGGIRSTQFGVSDHLGGAGPRREVRWAGTLTGLHQTFEERAVPRPRSAMRKIREVLRLSQGEGLSRRQSGPGSGCATDERWPTTGRIAAAA